MFDNKEDNKNEDPQIFEATTGSFEVKTMPKKFLMMRPSDRMQMSDPSYAGSSQSDKKTKQSKKSNDKSVEVKPDSSKKDKGLKKNIIIGIIVIVVLAIVMVVLAWLYVNNNKPEEPIVETPAVEEPTGQDKEEDNNPVLDEPEEDPVLDEVSLNLADWLRYDYPPFYELQYPPTWQATVDYVNEDFDKSLDEDDHQVEEGDGEGDVGDGLDDGMVVEEDVELFAKQSKVSFADSSNKAYFSVSIYDNPAGSSGEDFAEYSYSAFNQDYLESYTLNNKNSHRYNEDMSDGFYIISNYKNYIYEIYFRVSDDRLIQAAYDLVLANFKFTEEDEPKEIPVIIEAAIDSDQDGLTDKEELIYKTNQNRRDTDADSYLDGNEVANLYDPLSKGESRIYESSTVSTYLSDKHRYNLIYPAAWEVKGDSDSVILQDIQGEFIQVLVDRNDGLYDSISDWFAGEMDGSDLVNMSTLRISDNEALRSSDGMRVYFMDKAKENIFILVYNTGLNNYANFLTTFDMVIKSFSFMNN